MKLILLLLAAVTVVGLWLRILRNWRLGLALFLLYTPIAGAVQLWLYPAPWAVLIKDLVLVLPTYIAFAHSGEFAASIVELPRSLLTLLALLLGLLLSQALNPWGPGLMATLVGLKVWVFYLPMVFLGCRYIQDENSLLRLTRLFIGLVWLPCLVGIVQYLLALRYGYAYAISRFYGDAAAFAATQGFTNFSDVGLIRIPGTFAFPAQYLNYVLCMLVPVLGVATIEHDSRWLRLRTVSLWLLCIAGFTTGTRAAFVIIPAMLLLFYFLRRGLTGVVPALALIAIAFVSAAWAVGFDVPALFHMETELSEDYSHEIAAGMLAEALNQTWFGLGVGSNTGAARFALANADDFTIFENYYAKAVAELGVIGLVAVFLLNGCVILWALRVRRRLRRTPLEPFCDAAVTLFVAILIYDFKGTIIDYDPLNALYWLFAGVVLALPSLALRIQLQQDYAPAAAEHDLAALGYSEWVPAPEGR